MAIAAERGGMSASEGRCNLLADESDTATLIGPSILAHVQPGESDWFRALFTLDGARRRTMGICLLLFAFILSDHTYDKPFFLVYITTLVFTVPLIQKLIRHAHSNGLQRRQYDVVQLGTADQPLLTDGIASLESSRHLDEKLSIRETANLSLQFCLLWFLANYFGSACLGYASVASVTILTSTNSAWTLVFCALLRVERASRRKLIGVAASLLGTTLISMVDLSGTSDTNRGSFPSKTPGQTAIGISLATLSAVIYGWYVSVMKWRIGKEERVDMWLFFGLIGIFSLALLWPLFFVFHWTGIEPFELPPSGKVWLIVIINSLSSALCDICLAFAMLMTTPLVATMGLSLVIPLSLVGQMIEYGQNPSFMYWIGATVVFVAFLLITTEEHDKNEGVRETDDGEQASASAT